MFFGVYDLGRYTTLCGLLIPNQDIELETKFIQKHSAEEKEKSSLILIGIGA